MHNLTLPLWYNALWLATWHSLTVPWGMGAPTRGDGWFFHEVKIYHTNRGPKKEGERNKVIFFYGKMVILGWDMDWWRWIDGGRFLDYTTKDGKNSILNKNPGVTRAAD